MKIVLAALTLLSLPLVAPALAAQAATLHLQADKGSAIERRAHHCNTAAQGPTPRCSGV